MVMESGISTNNTMLLPVGVAAAPEVAFAPLAAAVAAVVYWLAAACFYFPCG